MDIFILKDVKKERRKREMIELKQEEMLQIKGGFSSALLNAMMRTVSVMFNLGQAVGSSIRRAINGKMC